MTPPRRTQMRGAERRSLGSSSGSWPLELCLGKETAGACKVLEKFLIIASTDISSFCKNSLDNTMGAPKTASAGERPVSSLGCARSPRSTKGNSSDQVAAAAQCAKGVLEAAVESLNRTVRLRVISSCLSVGDVEHLAQCEPEV
jgi:hypothetical protein